MNLLADTETTRRSCSSVGIPPLEIAAPVWLARDSEDTLRVKRLPMCSFDNDRLCGRAGPRTRRYDEHHDENRPSILASPLLALASKNSWTPLEGSSSSTRCSNLHPKYQGPRPCEGALVAQVGVLFAPCFSSVVLRVRVRRYYRVLLPLWVGTFEFQWT